LKKQSFAFAIGTILSRVSGLARDMAMTYSFGSSIMLEAFLLANRIPNLFRDMLCEGALGNAFTKVYTELDSKDKARSQALFMTCLVVLLIVFVVIVLSGLLLAPLLVHIVTYFASDDRGDLFSFASQELATLLFPFLGLAMILSVTQGALHARGLFFISALSPVLLNLGFLVGSFVVIKGVEIFFGFVYADAAITSLAVFILLGSLIQCLFQLFFLRSIFRQSTWEWQGLKKVLLLMAPATLAASSVPINTVIATSFATTLEVGSISWLNYAFRLYQLPVGVFAVAIALVSLPLLTRAIAQGKSDFEVKANLSDAMMLALWLMSFSFVCLHVCAHDIVSLLFERGLFTSRDSLETAKALQAYSWGLFAYGLVKVLSSYYFATDRIAFATKVSLISIFVHLIMNYHLTEPFGHVGIAYTSAFASWVNAAILLYGVGKLQWPIIRILALTACSVVAFFLAQAISFDTVLMTIIMRTASAFTIIAFGYSYFHYLQKKY
jgi:putative peptidoglycan lipid II flippase